MKKAPKRAEAAQIERETRSVQLGVERYRTSVARLAGDPTVRLSEAETAPGQKLMRELLEKLIPSIEQVQEEALHRLSAKGGSELRKGADFILLSLEPGPLAVITARTAFTTIRLHKGQLENGGRRAEERRVALADAIGRYVLQERRLERYRDSERIKANKGPEAVDIVELLKSRTKNARARQIRSWKERVDRIDNLDWAPQVRETVGADVLDCLVNCGDWFEKEKVTTRRGGYKTTWTVRPSTKTLAILHVAHGQSELTRPWLLPMICRPRDWYWDEEARRYRGDGDDADWLLEGRSFVRASVLFAASVG